MDKYHAFEREEKVTKISSPPFMGDLFSPIFYSKVLVINQQQYCSPNSQLIKKIGNRIIQMSNFN